MFELDFSKILVIGIVLIVVVGPKDLPHLLRQFGRTTSKLRAMAGDFRRQFDEALKEADLGDVAETLNSVGKINPMNEIRRHLAPIQGAGQQLRDDIADVMRPQANPAPAEAGAEPVAAEHLQNDVPASLHSKRVLPVVMEATPVKGSRRAKAAEGKAASSGAALPPNTVPVTPRVRHKPVASSASSSRTAVIKASKSNPAPVKTAAAKTISPSRKKKGSPQ